MLLRTHSSFSFPAFVLLLPFLPDFVLLSDKVPSSLFGEFLSFSYPFFASSGLGLISFLQPLLWQHGSELNSMINDSDTRIHPFPPFFLFFLGFLSFGCVIDL